MKKLLITIIAAVSLFGCGMIPVVPTFDNVEYNHFVEFQSLVKTSAKFCGSPNLIKEQSWEITQKAMTLDLYATHRAGHTEIKEVTKIILANAREFEAKYGGEQTPSIAYCFGKLKIIDLSLNRILPEIGDLQK